MALVSSHASVSMVLKESSVRSTLMNAFQILVKMEPLVISMWILILARVQSDFREAIVRQTTKIVQKVAVCMAVHALMLLIPTSVLVNQGKKLFLPHMFIFIYFYPFVDILGPIVRIE